MNIVNAIYYIRLPLLFMFKKIDKMLIAAAEKRKGQKVSFLDRIFRNKFTLVFVSMVLIYRTVDHAISSYHHHHQLLSGFYIMLAAILLVAGVRHHFFRKKIVTLELFITFFEAALFLWYGAIKVYGFIEAGEPLRRSVQVSIGTLMLVIFYFAASRSWYLVRTGKIANPHEEHAAH